MRFQSLRVANLRGVRLFEVDNLSDFIVVAGQNGSGKSCVFDAIRLLKSVYGGYSTDEYMQWFGEFAIDVQDRQALRRMFRDSTQRVEIDASVEFAETERAYMAENAADLLFPLAWERVTGQRMDPWGWNRMAVATQIAQYRAALDSTIVELRDQLVEELAKPIHHIAVKVDTESRIEIEQCVPVQVSFQAYRPENLGVVEYHSASRTYVRQGLGGINLDARAFEEQRRRQTLYNQNEKYQNVKGELAAGYLRNLIATASGGASEGEDLNETLKELFRTFFPDKEYDGVRPLPGGSLEFPVVVPGGGSHDIDDLSSGEKEILYGYLRLRNSTPRRSVILLDEPELHLNPSLLQGYADFYYRHLGVAQQNQLWLVTHSDTLLRQAIGHTNYRVYHMLTASATDGNQASEVLLDDDVERVVVDLVGDLAAYRPHAKIVILEGKGEDAFDATVIRRLFPDFARRVNLVSAENKRRVRDLYDALNSMATQAGVPNRFFAIVDSDAEGFRSDTSSAAEMTWSVYHIENFLLHPPSIRAACQAVSGVATFASDEEVVEALRDAAAGLVGDLVRQEIQNEINNDLVSAIAIAAGATDDVAGALMPSVTGSVERFNAKAATITIEALRERVQASEQELRGLLDGDGWLARYPGRDILRRFTTRHLVGVKYEVFRNVILEQIAQSDYRPENMQVVLQAILDTGSQSETSPAT